MSGTISGISVQPTDACTDPAQWISAVHWGLLVMPQSK